MDKDKEGQNEPTDEELIKQIRDEFSKLTVKDFLSQNLITLSTLAHQKMGIPAANKQSADLDQAKLAIDAYSALLKVLDEQLGSEERDALREILSKLQIEFVARSSK